MSKSLLSAKGDDINTWRAVENFVSEYRNALLNQAVLDYSKSSESIVLETCSEIETAISTHKTLLLELELLLKKLLTASEADLKELTISFYDNLYRHFGYFHSSISFYQQSMLFLRQISCGIIKRAAAHTGYLPKIAIVAIGPAGRCEYSPFSPIQILLVHSEINKAQLHDINQFCHAIHAGFEAAGLAIDTFATPRNPEWRGTLTEWRRRCEYDLDFQAEDDLINICRLVDQCLIYGDKRLANLLKMESSLALAKNQLAMTSFTERMASLSNGLTLMGRFKLKKEWMFSLLTNGLLPFSTALSLLSLIKKSLGTDNCERIHDLLRRGELDVELAEQMLTTWHTLHNMRLMLEQNFHIGEHPKQPLFLNIESLTVHQKQSLKEALESVAIIQHYAEITFSETVE